MGETVTIKILVCSIFCFAEAHNFHKIADNLTEIFSEFGFKSKSLLIRVSHHRSNFVEIFKEFKEKKYIYLYFIRICINIVIFVYLKLIKKIELVFEKIDL